MANQKNQTSNEGGGINQSGSAGGRGRQSGSAGTKADPGLTGIPSTGNLGGQTPSTGIGTSGIGSTGTGSTSSGISDTGSTRTGIGGTGSTSSSPGTGSTGTMARTGGSEGGTGTGAATARSLYDQAKETAGQAYEAAAEKATTKLEEQKTTLSGGLATVADSVRKVSQNLRGPDVQDGISKFTAEYSDTAARKIEDVANYFEQKSVREMYRDVENFARRNPAVFVGGAFALGLLLSRFLKSGANSYSSRSHHEGPISTATDEGSGQGIQGIAGAREIPTPGSSI